eukprot:TRINITY_DN33989_c0_g1_i1.p1 TRINITY_DN33989_c0_g1~~TRINITY_DN33989_c0_g1_i1.p1  ORF type:complete len:199 (+),score=43.15 TRINITY_DN33989_c0_g1_i1:23-598(+)
MDEEIEQEMPPSDHLKEILSGVRRTLRRHYTNSEKLLSLEDPVFMVSSWSVQHEEVKKMVEGLRDTVTGSIECAVSELHGTLQEIQEGASGHEKDILYFIKDLLTVVIVIASCDASQTTAIYQSTIADFSPSTAARLLLLNAIEPTDISPDPLLERFKTVEELKGGYNSLRLLALRLQPSGIRDDGHLQLA